MFQIRKGFEVDVAVAFVDDQNHPAQVDGAPTWSVSDDAVLTIVPGDDANSIVLQATGPVGSHAALHVEADADLGDGVDHVVASEEIHVVSGTAAAASFNFGEPRPIGGLV